ncbi:hypothetical protein ciss_07380 [Carboxydothermus islandicus]|uniref:Uncharacterized protein n=1 Tax=Carboxydothermus islandicus TaxID=661089 RepID=A0A1L8D0U0_9THEO|nr:hypothetical protein [Carboxydothermus islandicus]GAV24805.1 hypothetical protein ciss_07380 [Carboxydothermus islandicus]
MITPVILIDELKAFIEEVVQNYRLETNQQNNVKPPQVVTGYLPPKNSGPDPDFPFVIVRLAEGVDKEEGATVTVKIIVGAYSEDSQQGWRDAANMIQRIWQELFKRRVIARKFRVEYPMKFEIPEEQPYPHWIGVMTTVWTVAHPVMEEVDL